MGLLFVGLMALTLEFPLYSQTGNVLVDLMPDALGFLLTALFLRRLRENSRLFSRGLTLCGGFFVPALVFFAYEVMEISGISTVSVLLGLVTLIGRIIALYFVVLGFKDMEKNDEVELGTSPLLILLLCYAAISVIGYVAGVLIPFFRMIINVASNILALVFMVFIYRTIGKFNQIYEFK